jgi:hypothetical protein
LSIEGLVKIKHYYYKIQENKYEFFFQRRIRHFFLKLLAGYRLKNFLEGKYLPEETLNEKGIFF